MSAAVSIPIVLDCDPGHDDAVAILVAVAAPQIDLRAVTTTFGNCTVEAATRNALRVLTLVGATEVPVGAGASGPLRGETALGNYVHGASGLDGPAMPEPAMAARPEGALAVMEHAIASSASPVTLVATGPITNVARLISERPHLVDGVREVIFMGGSTERGNHTPTAEFNTFADPEALDVVLHSGLPVRMVGLNLTHQALATPQVVQRMRALDTGVGRTCAEWMGFFGSSYRALWEFEAPPVHDPCTLAALIEPDLLSWREAFVAVELDGRWTRGTTVVDLYRRYDQTPNVSVAMTLDVDGFWRLVLGAVESLGSLR